MYGCYEDEILVVVEEREEDEFTISKRGFYYRRSISQGNEIIGALSPVIAFTR